MSRVSARSRVVTSGWSSFMGSFFCKLRRGPTSSGAQRRKKLQHRDCLLRAPCMLCFLVREPAVSEPVYSAPRTASQDCAHLSLLNTWQERSCSGLHTVTSQEHDSDTLTMVCKRKNSGENQQPGTPCKQPRCSPAEEQAQELSEERAHPCPGGQTSAGDEGHPSTQHYQDHTPPCTGEPTDQPTGDPALPCTEELAQQPSRNPALDCSKKEDLPVPEEHSQSWTAGQGHPTYGTEPTNQNLCCASSSVGSSSSQEQPQTLREADPETHKVEDEPLNINQLPPSLLLKIFSHLSLNERCLSVSLVCKYWRDLLLDFQFWKQLDLSSRSQVKDEILEKIASRFWNITELNISDCLNVTDAGIGMLATKCSGLVKYIAYRCKQLSDLSLISLATHCTSLQKVHVGNQDRLTDEAIKQLGTRCKDLRDIHFGQCYKISDEGMVILAKGCPKLKKIYMQENKLVSDKSVEAFAEHCPELEYVGFMGCSVTSRGVFRLTNLKHLSSLDLRHINELDNETVMEIVKKCQNLTSLNLCLNRNIDDRFHIAKRWKTAEALNLSEVLNRVYLHFYYELHFATSKGYRQKCLSQWAPWTELPHVQHLLRKNSFTL
ncbi:F-box/LRR-repeat protein 17 isoform X2 [Rhinoderma darwinii]|uniref:F-box/LRR-repeat protein 17 isoform X2 n=1 Tax=Rhinoderma darwinii TaxID=43563 RepID=UPI003F679C4D